MENKNPKGRSYWFFWWIVTYNICFLYYFLSFSRSSLDIHTNHLKFKVVPLVTHIWVSVLILLIYNFCPWSFYKFLVFFNFIIWFIFKNFGSDFFYFIIFFSPVLYTFNCFLISSFDKKKLICYFLKKISHLSFGGYFF